VETIVFTVAAIHVLDDSLRPQSLYQGLSSTCTSDKESKDMFYVALCMNEFAQSHKGILRLYLSEKPRQVRDST
jgi:hypothetical protein